MFHLVYLVSIELVALFFISKVIMTPIWLKALILYLISSFVAEVVGYKACLRKITQSKITATMYDLEICRHRQVDVYTCAIV